MSIPLPHNDFEAANLLCVSFIAIFVNCIILCLSIFAFSDFLGNFENIALLYDYIWLLPIGIFGVGVYQAFSFWTIRNKCYKILAKTRISRSIAQIFSQLVLGILNAGPFGLLIGHVLGELSGSGALVRITWLKNKELLKSVKIREAKRLALKYKKFPLLMTGASVINSAGVQFPVILFVLFYGPEVAGWLFLTQKIMAIPITSVGRSISQVFIGEVGRIAKSNPKKMKDLFIKIHIKLLLFGTIPCLILTFFGEEIFKISFGEGWVQSGKYAQALAIVYLLKFCTESLINHALLERQELSLLWSSGRLILVCSVILYSKIFNYDALLCVKIYSIAMGFAYIMNLFLWIWAINCQIKKVKADSLCFIHKS